MSIASKNLTHRSLRRRHRGGLFLLVLLIVWGGIWCVSAYYMNCKLDQWVQRAKENNINFTFAERYTDGSPWKLHIHLKELSIKHPKGHRIEADEAILYQTLWDWNFMAFKLKGLIRGQVGGLSYAAEAIKAGYSYELSSSADQKSLWLGVRAIGVHPHVKEDPTFGRRIQELAFNVNVMGPLPTFDKADSIHKWRKDGGSFTFDKLALSWGPLALLSKGTVALNDELQPEGVFSARLRGVDQAIDLCANIACLSPNEEKMLRVSLDVLARPSSMMGHSSPVVPISVQQNKLYIGPVVVGTVPTFEWE